MRWLALGVVTAVVVGTALIACSAPGSPAHWTCQEGDDSCAADPKPAKRADPPRPYLGLPEPALAEDQDPPPPTALTSPQVQRDAGTPSVQNDEAGAPVPNVPSVPPPPVLDKSNACWSATLQAWVEVDGCYQRKSDAMWFQCGFDTATQSNLWFRNVVDGVGRFGPCSSLHPLQ